MTNFFEEILKGAEEVYISISTTNHLELGVFDQNTQTIKSYINVPIEYNEATREILDYDIFRAKIEKMFDECNLQPSKCNVHLNIPTVWFGFKDNIPISSTDENIKNIVINELDQSYIFKKADPIPAYFEAPAKTDLETKSIFYTAMQLEVAETFINIFKEMGANLVEITCSLISDIKGLITCGLAEEEIYSDKNWDLMILNNSGFQLFTFIGKKLIEFYEEPLPIKSLENEEIYSTINNAVQIALMSSEAQSLVIISETDNASANELVKKLQFNGKITAIENNSFRKQPLSNITNTLMPEVQHEVSLQLIGMFSDSSIFPIAINFLLHIEGYSRDDILEIPISSDNIIVLTKQKAMLYSIIAFVLLIIPLSLGTLASHIVNQKFIGHTEELDAEIADVTAKLKKYEDKNNPEFNPYKEIEKVLKNNRTKIMAYGALGDSVPKNLYLTYFMTGNNVYIDIQGYASTVEDVYIFFQNLKDYLMDAKLRVSKLDLQTSSSLEEVIEGPSNMNNAPYAFEITNMDENQLTAFLNALKASQKSKDKNNNKNNEKQKE